jgi:6-phosphofructokinase 1
MKRIGILTAGGDTPALNATIYGAVARANQLKIEVIGLIKGFNCLFDARVPHIALNPLFATIPELDATIGGTVLGASRDFVDPEDKNALSRIAERLARLKIEGLICIGGDGTLNGLQPLCDMLPTVLAPKTIDNDLGLNYPNEADEWIRQPCDGSPGYRYARAPARSAFDLENIVNYATPGYATAVFVSAQGVERLRTTAESHRRIGIVEVMGRHSGYIALGSSYGQPDLVLIPEQPLDIDLLVERVKEIYDLQQNVVLVCGEGITDAQGNELGAEVSVRDPAGNLVLTGAAEALRKLLIDKIGDNYFARYGESARTAIFTRKIGHTQRGGRPLLFDRFYASQLGGKAVEMLLEGQNNGVATLQWNRSHGFQVAGLDANKLRDRWGLIHARQMHASFYDPVAMKPSRFGVEYLLPIFTSAIGHDDVEHMRQTLFNSGNLVRPYHSVTIDIGRRTRYLSTPAER